MNDTQRLLTEYAATGSETAFGELVARYVDLVYATASRLLEENAHLAMDAAQLVFLDLAKKAPSLPPDVLLGGWLHRRTCFVAANLKRSERRRQSRERKAVEMNMQEDHSEANLAQVRPLLDEAINQLPADDRAAIVLRFFQQWDFTSVGAALGSSENAAQKRVARAVEELRSLLKRRGVVLSAAGLGAILTAQTASATPAGLAATISSAALAGAATSASTAGVAGFLVEHKVKIVAAVAGVAAAGVLTCGAGAYLLTHRADRSGQHMSQQVKPILFDDQKWLPWRTEFAVEGDKLVSQPRVRPGYQYGHGAEGRGPTLMTAIDDKHWKNYRAEFEYCVTGPDPAFNSYGLPSDYHDGAILFHVTDAQEDWNKKGNSMYRFEVRGFGEWTLHCIYNDYCAVPVGYGNPTRDAERKLAEGYGLNIDRVKGNKYAIEVNGPHIQIWVDGDKIADVIDDKMEETIGGQTLDHGGVGFHWGLDAMGWVKNFTVKPL